ncbi:hypothetical protein, partial [Thiolapillus sp.]|uniref:hypothetical protein n=1 Tax=Thiolapillus sp. TaxID=2017437 RepID=UPI0025F2B449
AGCSNQRIEQALTGSMNKIATLFHPKIYGGTMLLTLNSSMPSLRRLLKKPWRYRIIAIRQHKEKIQGEARNNTTTHQLRRRPPGAACADEIVG